MRAYDSENRVCMIHVLELCVRLSFVMTTDGLDSWTTSPVFLMKTDADNVEWIIDKSTCTSSLRSNCEAPRLRAVGSKIAAASDHTLGNMMTDTLSLVNCTAMWPMWVDARHSVPFLL